MPFEFGPGFGLLLVYVLLALFFSFLCSVAEAVLLSITPSYIAELRKRDAKQADRLQALKGEGIDRSLAAILTVNTIAHTVGAIGAGAKATSVFGDAWFGVFSAVMTLLILFLSEIVPKTIGAVHWRRLSGFTATYVNLLIKLTYPLILVSELLTRMIARGQKVHVFSRDEFVAMADIGQKSSLGDHAEALALLEAGMSVVTDYSPIYAAAVHNSLAHLFLDLGQTARSQQHLGHALGVDNTLPLVRAMSHLLHARLALDRSQPRVAAVALQAAQGFIIESSRYAIRGQAALLGARLQEPDAAYRCATEVALQAGRLQMQGLRMSALAWAGRHALACGLPAAAAAHAVEALALWPEYAPDDSTIAEVWLAAVDCLTATGDPRAASVLQAAAGWIAATARDRVPEVFRDSFLHRHHANRVLMARAASRA